MILDMSGILANKYIKSTYIPRRVAASCCDKPPKRGGLGLSPLGLTQLPHPTNHLGLAVASCLLLLQGGFEAMLH